MSYLKELIRQHIRDAGGWLGFDAFMQAALYTPGYGYYETATAFGEEGDFVTAAELGPWLALGLADLIDWSWKQMGEPSRWCLLEQGGGSGRVLCEVMRALEALDVATPSRLVAVEASTAMRSRQQDAYAQAGLDVTQVASLQEVDSQECCFMFSNELPDAFPVRCFRWQHGKMYERGVALQEDNFIWRVAPDPMQVSPGIDPALIAGWPEGYVSEWCPGLAVWQQEVSRVVQRGHVICIDYGYPASEYYRPGRCEGTLMAHHGHRGLEDVLSEPGQRDITAHVDFTALARVGRTAGLSVVSFMGQGGWLAQSPGIQQRIQALATARTPEAMREMAHARRMLLPEGMGETFKLCIQVAGPTGEPPPFLTRFDRRDALGI